MCSSLPKGKFVSEIFSFSLKTKQTKNPPSLLKTEFEDKGTSPRLKKHFPGLEQEGQSSTLVPGSPRTAAKGLGEKSSVPEHWASPMACPYSEHQCILRGHWTRRACVLWDNGPLLGNLCGQVTYYDSENSLQDPKC